MLDSIPRTKEVDEDHDYQMPRKANDYLRMHAGKPLPSKLFDEFWREGELALLFGPSGTGKSLFAMQIAEALARGRPIDGFCMPTKRQRVLYVDLKLSDRRFKARYDPYRFSENLHRLKLATTDKLCDQLRKTIAAERFRIVVIDDLSAIRQTYDGTRETLKLMRQLARLRDELEVSILVLSDCREPRNGVVISERDLLRSRILCDAADSAFAISVHPTCPYSRTILQTRSPELKVWNGSNAPTCWIKTTESGMLGLVFDKRFRPKLDDERGKLICEIKRRWDAGETYRQIASTLGISAATASRLRKKWQPGMENALPVSQAVQPDIETPQTPLVNHEPEEWEECDLERPVWLETDDSGPSDESEIEGSPAASNEHNIDSADSTNSSIADIAPARVHDSIPELPPPRTPRDILLALGFRRTIDANEREIFVEREDTKGNLFVWYRFDAKNKRSPKDRLSRIEYKGVGTVGMRVDGPVCLFNTS